MNYHSFNCGGFVIDDVPTELKTIILDSIEYSKEVKQTYNHGLAGHIEKEYYLLNLKENNLFQNYILNLVHLHAISYPDYHDRQNFLTSNVPLVIEDLWVNFQKKGEFNPLHDHRGLYSFVIWVKIPYKAEDEEMLYKTSYMNNKSQSGAFFFVFPNMLGVTTTLKLPVDSTWEWKVVLFPSKLSHFVNPFFSSDEERISISGNVLLKV